MGVLMDHKEKGKPNPGFLVNALAAAASYEFVQNTRLLNRALQSAIVWRKKRTSEAMSALPQVGEVRTDWDATISGVSAMNTPKAIDDPLYHRNSHQSLRMTEEARTELANLLDARTARLMEAQCKLV